jgi:hypothetical protein
MGFGFNRFDNDGNYNQKPVKSPPDAGSWPARLKRERSDGMPRKYRISQGCKLLVFASVNMLVACHFASR